MSFDLTLPLPEKGVVVPIMAAYTGHKKVPLWAVATNNANPKLRFFETEIELKVMRTHRRKWSDVESMDAQQILKSNNLTLNFADTPWNFTASLVLPRYLRETLRFLDAKGLVLSHRARAIMESTSS